MTKVRIVLRVRFHLLVHDLFVGEFQFREMPLNTALWVSSIFSAYFKVSCVFQNYNGKKLLFEAVMLSLS